MRHPIFTEAEPEVAQKFLEHFPKDEYVSGMETIAETIAEKDVLAALDWAKEVESPGDERVLRSVMHVWGNKEPRMAAEYLLKHMDLTDSEWRRTVGDIVSGWADYDAAQAVRWAEAVPDAGVRGEILGQVAWGLASTDPREAAALFSSVPAEVRTRQNLISAVVGKWTYSDIGAAEGWAMALPEGEEKGEALDNLVRALAKWEPTQAAAWLQELPAGISRDMAVERFTTLTVGEDPEGAMEWGMTIANPAKRAEVISVLGRTWLIKDRPALLQWMQNNPALDAETRAALLEMDKERNGKK
jgi:hypothetical protein